MYSYCLTKKHSKILVCRANQIQCGRALSTSTPSRECLTYLLMVCRAFLLLAHHLACAESTVCGVLHIGVLHICLIITFLFPNFHMPCMELGLLFQSPSRSGLLVIIPFPANIPCGISQLCQHGHYLKGRCSWSF